MTIPFSGIPLPVQGVTGGQGLPQGVASVEGETGNVVINPPSNVMQLRKGAIPQSLQIYETFTNNTNYIRLELSANTGGPFRISTEQAGSGIARPLILGTGNTDQWIFNVNGTLSPVTDDAYDLGTTTLRIRNIFLSNGLQFFVPAGGVASTLFSGNGLPGTGIGGIGDFYFRKDTPGVALQRLYTKTAAAVWTGVV